MGRAGADAGEAVVELVGLGEGGVLAEGEDAGGDVGAEQGGDLGGGGRGVLDDVVEEGAGDGEVG